MLTHDYTSGLYLLFGVITLIYSTLKLDVVFVLIILIVRLEELENVIEL